MIDLAGLGDTIKVALPGAVTGASLSNATTRKQIVDDMVNIQVTGKPGQVWQYCNQNFVLAGYLVQQLSGESWEQYTQQHIFKPLDDGHH